MVILGIPQNYSQIVTGTVVIVAVLLDELEALMKNSCFSAKKLSRRKKQNCTKERDQNPACVCFWNHWNATVAVPIPVIVTQMVLVSVALDPCFFIMIGDRKCR